jgi:hypothetical protein
MRVLANGLSLPDLDTLAALETGRYWTPAKRPSEPSYRPAINNGYWAEDIITDGLVLYVPLWLYSGSKFPSVDAYKHTCTVTGATWGLQGGDFNSATPDYIEIPASSTQLDFTSQDFSFIIRFMIEDLTANRGLLQRGAFNSGGIWWFVNTGGLSTFYTFQSGANQSSNSGAIVIAINTWYTLGVSRDGASVKIFANGIDVTATAGSHTDPATYNGVFGMGEISALHEYPFDGKIECVLAYSGVALSTAEHLHMHNVLKWRNG